MSVEYQKKLANKLKKIDKKYLQIDNSRQLVGEGITPEMEEVKEGMGLKGKGVSAGMKKMKKGKGYTAGNDMEGGFGFKDLLRGPATLLKAVVPMASVPLKVVGLGKKKGGAQLGYDGPPVWKDNLPKPFYYASGLSAGGYTAGSVKKLLDDEAKFMVKNENGEYQELEGGNVITKFLSGLLDKVNPLSIISNAVSESFNKGKKYGKRYGGVKEPKFMENEGRTGNQALIVGYGKKRGRKPKGAGVLSDIAKIANAPNDFVSKFTLEPPSFLESVIGRDNLRNIGREVSSNVVSKMLGVGKKAPKAPKKGPKKVNKRAEIVRQVMKDKGLKLIEASKYVKEHNLY